MRDRPGVAEWHGYRGPQRDAVRRGLRQGERRHRDGRLHRMAQQRHQQQDQSALLRHPPGPAACRGQPGDEIHGQSGHSRGLHPVLKGQIPRRPLHARPVGPRGRLPHRLRLRPELQERQHDAGRVGHCSQERGLHVRRDRLRRLPHGHAGNGHGAGALRRLHDRFRGD